MPVPCILLLPILLYDLRSLRRIHPVTLWAGGLLVLTFEIQFVLAETTAWHAVAAWVRSTGE